MYVLLFGDMKANPFFQITTISLFVAKNEMFSK